MPVWGVGCGVLLLLGVIACAAGAGSGEPGAEQDEARQAERRRQMIEAQIRRRGVDDARVLAAIERVPRHAFVRR